MPVTCHVFDFVVKLMAEKFSPRSHSPSSELPSKRSKFGIFYQYKTKLAASLARSGILSDQFLANLSLSGAQNAIKFCLVGIKVLLIFKITSPKSHTQLAKGMATQNTYFIYYS